MSFGRRSGAALVAFVVVGALTIAHLAPPASGQSTAGVQLELAEQSAYVPTRGSFRLVVRGERVPPGLSLALTLHQRLSTRTAFNGTINGTNLGPTVSRVLSFPWDTLPLTATGGRELVVSLPDQLNASSTGVYPLEVQLREDDERTLTGFVTHLIVAEVNAAGDPVVGTPLDVAWVWPLTAPPAYLPNGEPDPDVVASLRASGRLGRQAAALGAHPDLPVTLAPNPETLDAWRALSEGSSEGSAGYLSVVARRPQRQIVAGPFVPLHLPSLLSEGFGDAVITEERQQGLQTLQEHYGTQLDARTALPGPLDGVALGYLRDRNVEHVIVEDGALTTGATNRTPATPFVVGSTAASAPLVVSGVAADPGFTRLLDSDHPPALRAAHVLAGLTFVQRELPNSDPRGVVLLNPPRWDAPPQLLDALMKGLATIPMLKPVTVAQMFEEVSSFFPNGNPIVRDLTAIPAASTPVSLSQYNEASRQLASLRSLLPATDERIERAKRSMLVVLTSEWATAEGRERARRQLAAIGAELGAFLARIRAPVNSTITITSSRAEIPISLLNETGQSVVVHVKLTSDKLLFPDGAERDVTLPVRNSTVRFAVETRSAGTFPILVTLTSADGGYVIQESRMKVRSTFVSGVGIFLTIGAVAFLALWWGNDIRRRSRLARKARHPGAAS